ncbi:MAG: adenylate/guanylate cyclase domain-containing protein [Leptospiraceae bacterium]|nr:adenylate/guanylate cyclase domain-containing protein [Leptospiraceae bacterium]
MKILLRIILLLCITINCSEKKNYPEAVHGVLDLSNIPWSNDSVMNLNGEWEFYFETLELNPIAKTKIHYTKLPKNWNGTEDEGKTIHSFGYATYRLKLVLPKNLEEIWFRSYEQATSYSLFANGKLILNSGKVGRTKEESMPHTTSTFGSLALNGEDEIDIVLQVSNFEHRKGGLWHAIKIGTKKTITYDINRRKFTDAFVSGSLFMLFCYYITIYLLRRAELSSLFFALFCLCVALRTMAVQEKLILFIFPELTYIYYVKLDYIATFLACSFSYHFLTLFFENKRFLMSSYINLFINAIIILFVLFANVYYTSYTTYAFNIVSSYAIILSLIQIYFAIKNKTPSAFAFLLGFLLFTLTVINDSLNTFQIISTGYITGIGLLMWMFSLSYSLSAKLFHAFKSLEEMKISLSLANNTIQKFVPFEFLALLGKTNISEINLGDEAQKEMTILFSDIRSFTAMAEKMTPRECFDFLNMYLGKVGPVIRMNHGFIDKYIGDGIMALFPESPDDAVNAAIDIQKEIISINLERENECKEPIEAGIGIHKGLMSLGVIGEDMRTQGTVISDAVNLASRIEELTKLFKTKILISSETFIDLEDSFEYNFRFLDVVQIKGKERKVAVVEILDGLDEETLSLYLSTKGDFEMGLNKFNEGNFLEAISFFNKVIEKNPNDNASIYYIQKSNEKLRFA